MYEILCLAGYSFNRYLSLLLRLTLSGVKNAHLWTNAAGFRQIATVQVIMLANYSSFLFG